MKFCWKHFVHKRRHGNALRKSLTQKLDRQLSEKHVNFVWALRIYDDDDMWSLWRNIYVCKLCASWKGLFVHRRSIYKWMYCIVENNLLQTGGCQHNALDNKMCDVIDAKSCVVCRLIWIDNTEDTLDDIKLHFKLSRLVN